MPTAGWQRAAGATESSVCHTVVHVAQIAELMAEIRVGKQGRVVIPSALREEMGLRPGDKLSAEVDEGRLVLEKRADALSRVQRRYRQASGKRKLVDELIAERRAAAAREGRD